MYLHDCLNGMNICTYLIIIMASSVGVGVDITDTDS